MWHVQYTYLHVRKPLYKKCKFCFLRLREPRALIKVGSDFLMRVPCTADKLRPDCRHSLLGLIRMLFVYGLSWWIPAPMLKHIKYCQRVTPNKDRLRQYWVLPWPMGEDPVPLRAVHAPTSGQFWNCTYVE